MKNKMQVMNQHSHIKFSDWLYQPSFTASQFYYKSKDSLPAQRQLYFPMKEEIQEVDFLLGKTPNKLEDSWEEEE